MKTRKNEKKRREKLAVNLKQLLQPSASPLNSRSRCPLVFIAMGTAVAVNNLARTPLPVPSIIEIFFVVVFVATASHLFSLFASSAAGFPADCFFFLAGEDVIAILIGTTSSASAGGPTVGTVVAVFVLVVVGGVVMVVVFVFFVVA